MTRPVVLIAWDGAEPSLLRRGMDEGWLPVLGSLRARGRAYAVGGPHRDFPGSAWPSTITGTDIARHGVFMDRQVPPGTYDIELRGSEDLREPPFWRLAADAGVRSVVAGVPAAPVLEDFDGVQACGWGVSDPYWKEGEPVIRPERWRAALDRAAGTRVVGLRSLPSSARQLLAYRDRIVRGTRDQAAGLELLMREVDWGLFVGGFGEPHQAGKLLWTTMEGAADRAEPGDLLPALYRALDEALGRLVDAAGPDTRFLVLSPHGMGGKAVAGDPLGRILERGGWLARRTGPGRPSAKGLARAAWRLGRRVTTRRIRGLLGRVLPRDRWHVSLMLGDVDWGRTTAFPLVPDHLSFLRVNVAGREPAGVVPPGETGVVIDEVCEALRSLEDAESGRPAVAELVRPVERHGEAGGILPDLAVRWSGSGGMRCLRSAVLGTIEIPVEGRETGMPRLPGFLVAAGPGIEPDGGEGLGGPEISVVDLAPTVLEMLGLEPRPDLPGRGILGLPLQELLP